MKGLKFIKTIFGDKKEIICVTFDGDNNYQLFLDEGKYKKFDKTNTKCASNFDVYLCNYVCLFLLQFVKATV